MSDLASAYQQRGLGWAGADTQVSRGIEKARTTTYFKNIVQQLQRSNLVVVDRLREVELSQNLTKHVVLLYVTAVITSSWKELRAIR